MLNHNTLVEQKFREYMEGLGVTPDNTPAKAISQQRLTFYTAFCTAIMELQELGGMKVSPEGVVEDPSVETRLKKAKAVKDFTDQSMMALKSILPDLGPDFDDPALQN